MVYNNHNIELYINDVLVDTSDDLNIRLNNVLYDPSEMNSKSADYSFSFDLPSTKTNDKVFMYARVLSVTNKFVRTLPSRLYADGRLLFDGTITLNSYKEGKYNVNLVSIKVVDFANIFGEATMNELDWYIPFEGAPTINLMNMEGNGEVTFPLVSYGAFQKKAKIQDEVGAEYTSKFNLDEYNRWYLESYYPSPNMLTTLKKCFEHKGFSVNGDVFNDDTLKSIYTSVNLADNQDPTYNLANPKFGKVSIDISATTSNSVAYEQELAFPYFKVEQRMAGRNSTTAESYNWQSVMLYDLLSSGQTKVMRQSPCYMYQPNEHIIVIPSSGFYKIDMEVSSITQTNGTFTAECDVLASETNPVLTSTTITVTKSMKEATPVEIHLVRNYDDDIELIKGRRNVMYTNGNPNTQVWSSKGNKNEWLTCFPHCDPYTSKLPTEKNGLSFRNTNTRTTRGNSTAVTRENGGIDTEAESQGRRGSGTGTSTRDGSGSRTTTPRSYYSSCKGYMYAYDGSEIMAYDEAANPNFICGISTLSNGVPSVIKNGRSWSATIGEEASSFYKQNGYWRLTDTNSGSSMEHTTAYENDYIDAPSSYVNVSDLSSNGRVTCMVWLEKNDVLQLFAVHRGYNNGGASVTYASNIEMSLKIEAASPYDYASLKLRNYGYGSSSDFDQNLRIGNFLSSSMRISDWVQDIVKSFNFSVIQDGSNIFINKKQQFGLDTTSIVDIDSKANSDDAEISGIDYPSKMAVRYSINTDEYGFECSVPDTHINDADWIKYGDSGYTVIDLTDKMGATELYTDTKLSYCWYVPFNWYNVTSADTLVNSSTTTVWLPTIAKSEWMIDGYDYTESMKYDGYGLNQRLWFTPLSSSTFEWLDVYPPQRVNNYIPTNERNGINLSYKTSENSLLTNYFSITPYNSSNYVTIDVYLTADEYSLIKNGARVKFDSDVYYPVDISGFDPSGNNPTSLKLIKRV